MRPVTVIGAASSAGAYAPGQELGPRAVRDAGLLAELRAQGIAVRDAGDIPTRRWRPDHGAPRARNAPVVAAVAGEVSELVASAIGRGDRALVLGGDCTVGVGSVAGLLTAGARTGLLYFDLHADMNTPESTSQGALDWMGVAHMLDLDGVTEQLADVGPRRPLLQPEDIVFIGLDREATTPHEREQLDRHGMRVVGIDQVRADPRRAAAEALALFGDQVDAIALHFDVDVVDFGDVPLAENTTANIGLRLTEAQETLTALAADDRVSVVTVTEFNPLHGAEDGADTNLLRAAVVRALL